MFFFNLSDHLQFLSFFFFNDTATTEIYTLSLHDALPILSSSSVTRCFCISASWSSICSSSRVVGSTRSEEHTSELQSRLHLVCRLLLEKKKIYTHNVCPSIISSTTVYV